LSCVLDASALLAFLQGESGAERVAEALARPAAISAVNYAEALGKLAEDGETAEELARRFEAEGLIGGVLEVEAVLPEDAPAIAALRRSTRHLGLSLGDRACLALALRLRRPVMTADRAWQELGLEVEVQAIR
jgi:PIN domain nuclease of toxin-antitoxin system